MVEHDDTSTNGWEHDSDSGDVYYDAQAMDAIRRSSQYQTQRDEFRKQCRKMSMPLPDGTPSDGLPCWLCNRAIDYKLKHPHPESWSLDHAKTVKEAPQLIMDIGNWRASHLDCNQRRGTDEPFIDIGEPSEEW